jgi:hypothetical protein
MRDKYVKSKAIDKAITAIQRGEFQDYANTTKNIGITRMRCPGESKVSPNPRRRPT